METTIVALLRSRPLVTATEAASLLSASESDVSAAFAAVARDNAGAYALLTGAVEEAARNGSTKVTLRKVDSVGGEAASQCALMPLTYPTRAAASAQPVALVPLQSAALRAYPVVTRTIMEARKDDAPRQPPVFTPLPVEVTAQVSVKLEPKEAVAPSPTAPPPAVADCTAPPARVPTQPRSEVPPAPPAPTVMEAATPSVPAPTVSVKVEAVSDAEATAPPASPARKPSIFDKMKEAAATKRPREAEEGPAKAKKAPAAKPKKAAKVENTTSLAKLARASKKKAGAAPVAVPSSSHSFLDEDDGDAMNGFSTSGESTTVEPMACEEAPVLDVVEVSASNDDVILCDDAAPLAFRPADPLPPPSMTKKEAPSKKPSAVGSAAVAASGPSAAQCTLGSFFNPAVVAFQKSYVREVRTETKMENGEYVCVDVPCYKHTATGEVISEDEYHHRTAQLVQTHDASTPSPLKPAGVQSDAAVSPDAAAAKTTHASFPEKDRKAKAPAAPAKTLMSFFKPTA